MDMTDERLIITRDTGYYYVATLQSRKVVNGKWTEWKNYGQRFVHQNELQKTVDLMLPPR